MTPAAGIVHLTLAAAGDGRACAGIHGDAVAFAEGGGESRFAIASGYDHGSRPDLIAELCQIRSVRRRSAAGQERADPINRARHFAPDLENPFATR